MAGGATELARQTRWICCAGEITWKDCGELGGQRFAENGGVSGSNLRDSGSGRRGAGACEAIRVVQQDVRVRGARSEEPGCTAVSLAAQCAEAQAQSRISRRYAGNHREFRSEDEPHPHAA